MISSQRTNRSKPTLSPAHPTAQVASPNAHDKVLNLLDSLAVVGTSFSLADATRASGLTKSTALRLLQSLERRGYVKRSDGNRYSVSKKFLILGHQALVSSPLRNMALPLLINLSETLQEAANLAVPYWPKVLYFERVIPVGLQATFSPIGKLAPFHATAVGKAIAAFQPLAVLDVLFRVPLEALTDRTKVDRRALEREFQEIRTRGWAFDDGELRAGVRCIAAPVYDASRTVIASIGLSSIRSTSINDDRHVGALLDAVANLSGLLGYF